MSRKETTELLTNILISDKLSDRKYYAKEVTLDYGTANVKRVDVMQFIPGGVVYSSDIEKGIFVCYEIKSCIEDVYSNHGLNFFGEKNYIVTTMVTYKQLQEDIREGKFTAYLSEKHPESSQYYGILVPIPKRIDVRDADSLYREFKNPSDFDGKVSDWKLWTAIPCRQGPRNRSMSELLFCMLRSKHSYSNS